MQVDRNLLSLTAQRLRIAAPGAALLRAHIGVCDVTMPGLEVLIMDGLRACGRVVASSTSVHVLI